MDRASFVEYKGKQIYFINYTNIKSETDFMAAIRETNEFRKKVMLDGKKDLLMLVDFTNSYVLGDVLKELKRSAAETKPITKKSAVVGITGSKKVLLNIVNSVTHIGSKPFDTIEEAKEWLIK